LIEIGRHDDDDDNDGVLSSKKMRRGARARIATISWITILLRSTTAAAKVKFENSRSVLEFIIAVCPEAGEFYSKESIHARLKPA
jgi:hypothetical protein